MNIYLVIILSLLLAQFLFQLVIEGVNLMNLSDAPPPHLLGDDYPLEKYRRSQRYLKENTLLNLIHSAVLTLLLFGLILSGAFNDLDLFARSFGLGSIGSGLLFFGFLYLGYELIQLPFDIYHTFVIEENYGFNRTTPKTFILDLLKKTVITLVIGPPILASLIWFFEAMGPHAWFYSWMALTAFQLLLTYVTPTWIMPLFNRFIPLADGELKNTIEAYAKKENFALKGIFTMDNSKRSTKSNAFFVGFGKHRRIVLFDTLIANHTTEELVSILAHEVGHYKKRHIFKLLILSFCQVGCLFYLFSWFLNNPELFQAFGMEHLSVYASLLFFSFLFIPIQTLLSIVGNAFSRRFEYEADAYAVESYHHPESMIDALKKLSIDNLANLTPHPWKVMVSYSHPPVLQRIRAIKKLEKTIA